MLRDFRISYYPHWRLARSLYRPRSGCGTGDASGLALGARRAVVHRRNHRGYRGVAHRFAGGHVCIDCRAPQLAGYPAVVRRRVFDLDEHPIRALRRQRPACAVARGGN